MRRSADPLRSSAAASVLANIHFHPDNATTLYKAELKLKYAALLQLQGEHGTPWCLHECAGVLQQCASETLGVCGALSASLLVSGAVCSHKAPSTRKKPALRCRPSYSPTSPPAGMERTERVRLVKLPAGMSPDKPPAGVSLSGTSASAFTSSPGSGALSARPASAAPSTARGDPGVRTSVRLAQSQIAASMQAMETLAAGGGAASSPGVGPGARGQPGSGGASPPKVPVGSIDLAALASPRGPASTKGGEEEGPPDPAAVRASMEAQVR